jgi:hypothetical protein
MKHPILALAGILLASQGALADSKTVARWSGLRVSNRALPCGLEIKSDPEIGAILSLYFEPAPDEGEGIPEADLMMVMVTGVSMKQVEKIMKGPGPVQLSSRGIILPYEYRIQARDSGGSPNERAITIQQNNVSTGNTRVGVTTILLDERGRPRELRVIKKHRGLLGNLREVFNQRCKFY